MSEGLSDVDVRVLGSLIEKAMTTPEYYPLSLNALVSACNQQSNRDPVVRYDEETVNRSIDTLRRQALVRGIKRADSRVTKYSHLADEALSLDPAEAAVMCVLLLRGPQTLAEVKTRSARMVPSSDAETLERALEGLAARQPTALVTRLTRQPGQKEARYAHTLSGDVIVETVDAPVVRGPSDGERIAALEEATLELRQALADLRAELESLRKSFE